MNVRQAINCTGHQLIGFWGGALTLLFKKQPSKAQYKKKVVLRSLKNIRTNHYQTCRNNYLKYLILIDYYYLFIHFDLNF